MSRKVFRTFDSADDVLAFNEEAKSAMGLPRPGTTDWVLPREPSVDEETGEVDDGLTHGIARGDRPEDLTAALVREDLLTAEELAALASAYDSWQPDIAYAAGDIREHDGRLYVIVQPHTSQDGWEPPNVPALWRSTVPEGVIPAWAQPTSAEDAYATGDEVTHPDRANTMGEGASTVWVWRSKIDANTTEPGQDGSFHRWWEPVGVA